MEPHPKRRLRRARTEQVAQRDYCRHWHEVHYPPPHPSRWRKVFLCTCQPGHWRKTRSRACPCTKKRPGNPKVSRGVCHLVQYRPTVRQRQEARRVVRSWMRGEDPDGGNG